MCESENEKLQCWRELVQKYYYLFILWIHPQKFHYTYFMMVAPSYKPSMDIKIYFSHVLLSALAFHFSPIIISYLLLLLSFVLIRLNIISYVRWNHEWIFFFIPLNKYVYIYTYCIAPFCCVNESLNQQRPQITTLNVVWQKGGKKRIF